MLPEPAPSGLRARPRAPSGVRAYVVVVAILATAATFEWLTANPIHAAFLYAVAFALACDGLRRGPAPDQRDVPAPPAGTTRAVLGRRTERLIVVGLLLWAWVAGFFVRFSWPMTVAVLVPCAVAVTLSWRGARSASALQAVTRRGALKWVLLFVVAALFELTNLLLQPSFRVESRAHPTISVLMDPVLSIHTGRTVTLVVWLAIGSFLLDLER